MPILHLCADERFAPRGREADGEQRHVARCPGCRFEALVQHDFETEQEQPAMDELPPPERISWLG